MKKIFGIFLLASVLLSACGVTGPEQVSWNTSESDTEFSQVDSAADIPEIVPGVIPSPPPESEPEYPWNELIGEENRLNCERNQIRAYECFGDNINGYKCIGDACYIFYNQKTYRMKPEEAEKYKKQVLGAYVASKESDTMGWTVAGIVLMGVGVFASGPVGWVVGGAGLAVTLASTTNELTDEAWAKYGRKGGADYTTIPEEQLSQYKIK